MARNLPDPITIRDALDQVAQFGVLGSADPRVVDVGTAEFLAYFEHEVIDDLVACGGATCKFFEGSYGAGKTHLLRLLSLLALDRGMATVQTDLSQHLSLDDWSSITKHILQNIETRVDGIVLRGLPRILDALKETDWVSPLALRSSTLPHVGFHNAMFQAIVEPDIPLPLQRFLSGERVTAKELRAAGVNNVKEPLTRRNAELVLMTVVAGLFYLGVKGTMLLFDENERTLVTSRGEPPHKMKVAANVMRRLVDACANGGLIGTTAVFAVLPEFLDNCSRHYPALGQRLEMAREQDLPPAWRWPVLPVDTVSAARHRTEFVNLAVARLVELVEHCGGETHELRIQLLHAGREVLNEHAGSGFRRALMKRLAVIALQRLD